ncbi:uncharacterized protein LOC107490743 [Arachis duranensis]|uniref:Uncharacterized protein LOC107490743 n=1 Tax=Arachis duranensis TaxID=130453 RepID=A0A6P4DH72_ARADU|nr:uncharacterized protein LOC107490743 [Arachis duranensis]
MGNQPLGTFPGWSGASQIPYSGHQLLHQMDRGRTIGQHIIRQLQKVHVETNGQVESANKVILLVLKKRLDNKKGAWADELASVLWSYRTTELSSTGETPFRLTYGVDAMITVEIGESSPRILLKGVEEAVEKDLVDEAREMAHLTEVALKQRMALRYNTKVLRREFGENDPVLRRNDIGLSTQGKGKLAAKWEGPYRVRKVLGKGAYKLEKLDGKKIPRT